MFYNKALAWDHINLKYRWTPVSRIRPHMAQYSGEWSFVTQPSKQQARVHRIELEVARTGIWKTTIKLGFFLSCAPPKPHCPTWELGNDECSDESRGLSDYLCPALLFNTYLMYRVTCSSHLHKELLITLTPGFQPGDWSFSSRPKQNNVSWECCILIKGI